MFIFFRSAISLEFLSVDENARLHRCVDVSYALESEDINRMQWPAYFPKLNPIDYT